MTNTTATTSLTAFLLDRIAEDELVAQAATLGPWRHDPAKEWHTDRAMLARAKAGRLTFDGEEFVAAGSHSAPACVAATGPSDDLQSMADADHIARHDPARVLAECAAKRALIAAHNTQVADDDPSAWIVGSNVILRQLAGVYADHPGYDPAWAVSR